MFLRSKKFSSFFLSVVDKSNLESKKGQQKIFGQDKVLSFLEVEISQPFVFSVVRVAIYRIADNSYNYTTQLA